MARSHADNYNNPRKKEFFMDPLLTKKDVCTLLQCCERKVNSLMKAGKLVYVKIGHDVRFFLHDVMRYLESCRRIGQPEPVKSKNLKKNP